MVFSYFNQCYYSKFDFFFWYRYVDISIFFRDILNNRYNTFLKYRYNIYRYFFSISTSLFINLGNNSDILIPVNREKIWNFFAVTEKK